MLEGERGDAEYELKGDKKEEEEREKERERETKRDGGRKQGKYRKIGKEDREREK